MGLAQFERRLEALVEGVFTRGSRSSLEPLELARKLRRAMGEERSVGLHGEVLVPNQFRVGLAPSDHERFAPIENALCGEIASMLRAHADEERWSLLGPVGIELAPDLLVRRGRLAIHSWYKEAEGPTGGALLLPDGRTVALSGERTVIGRLTDCDVALTDPNASRRHAEVRWNGREYELVDLGSMNGTYLNDTRVKDSRLRTGDVITVGKTRIEVRLA